MLRIKRTRTAANLENSSGRRYRELRDILRAELRDILKSELRNLMRAELRKHWSRRRSRDHKKMLAKYIAKSTYSRRFVTSAT